MLSNNLINRTHCHDTNLEFPSLVVACANNINARKRPNLTWHREGTSIFILVNWVILPNLNVPAQSTQGRIGASWSAPHLQMQCTCRPDYSDTC